MQRWFSTLETLENGPDDAVGLEEHESLRRDLPDDMSARNNKSLRSKRLSG